VRRGLASILAMFRVPMWVGAAYAVLRANADPDLWGHVRFGLDLIRARHLPAYDPYSFTSDLSWVNHEWLAELFMGAAYAVVGPVGLILIKGVFTAATVALIISSVIRAPEHWRWSSGFLAVLAIVPIAITVRPQLWTMLLLMLLCRILVGAASSAILASTDLSRVGERARRLACRSGDPLALVVGRGGRSSE